MRIVSEADVAVQTLPELFEEAKSTPIIVSDDGVELGAIISMEDFAAIRHAKAESALGAMDALGGELRQSAARAGVSIDDLEKMLDRKAP